RRQAEGGGRAGSREDLVLEEGALSRRQAEGGGRAFRRACRRKDLALEEGPLIRTEGQGRARRAAVLRGAAVAHASGADRRRGGRGNRGAPRQLRTRGPRRGAG